MNLQNQNIMMLMNKLIVQKKIKIHQFKIKNKILKNKIKILL